MINAGETWRVAAADGVRCARVRSEINFLLTSETALFSCVYRKRRTSQDILQRTVNSLAVLPGSSVYEPLDIAVLSGIDS